MTCGSYMLVFCLKKTKYSQLRYCFGFNWKDYYGANSFESDIPFESYLDSKRRRGLKCRSTITVTCQLLFTHDSLFFSAVFFLPANNIFLLQ